MFKVLACTYERATRAPRKALAFGSIEIPYRCG